MRSGIPDKVTCYQNPDGASSGPLRLHRTAATSAPRSAAFCRVLPRSAAFCRPLRARHDLVNSVKSRPYVNTNRKMEQLSPIARDVSMSPVIFHPGNILSQKYAYNIGRNGSSVRLQQGFSNYGSPDRIANFPNSHTSEMKNVSRPSSKDQERFTELLINLLVKHDSN